MINIKPLKRALILRKVTCYKMGQDSADFYFKRAMEVEAASAQYKLIKLQHS